MKIIKSFGSILLMFGLSFSMSHAYSNSDIVGGLIYGVIQANQAPPPKKKTYERSRKKTSSTKKRSTKKVSSIPKSCSSERWTVQSINNKPIATSFQGIIVAYSDMGDIIVKVDIKNPIPSMFKPGDKVQLNVKFNKGSRSTSATLDENNKNLLIMGMDALYIANKLKSSSYVQVDFVNNKYCSRLKNSSKSIGIVEFSATLWKKNKPDHIDKARVTRAKQEHKDHSRRVASNQKEFSEKVKGIRPKSDLDAADGNIYGTKIQYYIPGSEEIGEMWIKWFIDDEKGPMLKLHFIDPTHQYENKTHEIDISLQPIQFSCNTDLKVKPDKNTSPSCNMVKQLLRVDKWSKIAKEKGIKLQYRREVAFIQGDETSKISLAVYFQIYENGAMTAQIEQTKHGFPKQFNFTIAQALELAKYIESTREKAQKQWLNKTRTEEDIDALFN
ncbi:MAG: hypothetical protein KAI79_15980 [Bacteroidales bacterium]|nr:hypothetical protein [Bacteroidales bacterium]